MASLKEYAQLADQAYASRLDRPTPTFEDYRSYNDGVDSASGLGAVAHFDRQSNTIAVSFSGTNPISPADWITNIQIGTSGLASNLPEARAFVLEAIDEFRAEQPRLVFVGHSQGGYFAQALLDDFADARAVVFNSTGLGGVAGTNYENGRVHYVYSNPGTWGSADTLIHTTGGLVSTNVTFVRNASGHGRQELIDALPENDADIDAISTTEIRAILIEMAAGDNYHAALEIAANLNNDPNFVGFEDIWQQVFDEFQANHPGARCFPNGTPILLADGHEKPIEEIKPGDDVLAFDGFGALVPRKVTRLFRNTTEEWIELAYRAEDQDKILHVTPGHSFLTWDGGFAPIGDLVARGGGAAEIVLADGERVRAVARHIAYSADTAHLFEAGEEGAIVSGGHPIRIDEWRSGENVIILDCVSPLADRAELKTGFLAEVSAQSSVDAVSGETN